MKDGLIIIGVIALLLLVNSITGGEPIITVPNNTTTDTTQLPTRVPPIEPAPPPRPPEPNQPSDAEIEAQIAAIFAEIKRLELQIAINEKNATTSPYKGKVTLQIGTARQSDFVYEYLGLQASLDNEVSINISDWFLESTVSDNRAALPQGARVLKSQHSRTNNDIYLEPGEYAYIITGESPLRVDAFHENQCSGYLHELFTIYPTMRNACPRPIDEMQHYDRIKLDDDICYDFVERQRSCRVVDEDRIDDANLSRQCERFAEDYLNYDGCVAQHQNDVGFTDIGYWRIYLDHDEELWRYEREIIRLIDELDRVVDTLEY